MLTITPKNTTDLIQKYLQELDWQVKENANMGYSLQGMRNYISNEVTKDFWLSNIYPKEIGDAHIDGDFHIHDLGELNAYCVGWDLMDLLSTGFRGVEGKVACNPPKHLSSALGQMVNFIFTTQGETAGAQAFSNFDTLLAPFIRYDKLDYNTVKQEIQSFVFNMNVATRVGFQTPFSNIAMDLNPPKYLADQAVIIGGKPQKETYKDFQLEMDIINQAFAEVMLEGDGDGRVFTFPIPTYNITKEFDWDDDRIEAIWRMTAKYGTPGFVNYINSDMDPDDARSMCPLAGDEKVLIKSTRGRGLEFSEIRNIYEGNSNQQEYEIYSHGKFIKGRFNKFENQEMLKITLANNHTIKMSKNHLNFVLTKAGETESVLKAEELQEGMYLPYSLNKFEGEGGTFDLGYLVGAFAGDGSFIGNSGVVFSLGLENKPEIITKIKEISKKYFGANFAETRVKNLISLSIHSKALVGLCNDFVAEKQTEKHYKARLFATSIEFRQGVLAGHYATDGGNRNRIYTSSKKMIQSLNMLAASLGTTTSIYEDDREGRFGEGSNYAVLIYQLNRQNYGDIWFKQEQKLWMQIKKVENISNLTAYCFEVKDGEPIFTVAGTGILTHNCRLKLDKRELRKRGGGLFGSNPLTGSIGVVTINLPRIGFLSKTKNEFYHRLEKLMEQAKESLLIKREIIEKYTEEGLYPYTKFYLRGVKQKTGKYWFNHFSTIGLLGMNEACLNLFKKDITTPEGQEFTKQVLDFMRDKILGFQEQTGDLFNLEATPAEGTSYRLARLDQKKFEINKNNKIKFANQQAVEKTGAEPYYTNSTHLPVYFTEDVFTALDLQDEIQSKYTGGTCFHAFLGEKVNDPEMIKKLVKTFASNYKIPYIYITPTFSICPKHGYVSGEHPNCPECQSECEVYSRIVGYLRPVKQWNKGKQQEFAERKEYVVG